MRATGLSREIRPSKKQEQFLSCSADIAIYGGQAGGGKSFALLMDPLRGMNNPHFRAGIFRRTMPNITRQNGLWQEAKSLYLQTGAQAKTSPRHVIEWPSGASLAFSHLQHVDDVQNHKGAQYTAIYFDELTEFEESQFWYLQSRLRSPGSGIRPYARATTNPDPDSWVRRLLDWWIDPDTGFVIEERSGVLRYFVRDGDALKWVDADYRDEDGDPPTSITFIHATLSDNTAMVESGEADEYRRKLKVLGKVEQDLLLKGNWNSRQVDGLFEHHAIDEKGILPGLVPWDLCDRVVRYWDLADTEPHEKNKNPDCTASAKGFVTQEDDGVHLYILDITNDQLEGAKKHRMMRSVATRDGMDVEIFLEQEGGASGKEAIREYKTRHLAGFHVEADRPSGSKTQRANVWKPLAETGHVHLVLNADGSKPAWIDPFMAQLSNFDGTTTSGKKRDMIDAVSGLYGVLSSNGFAWVI